MKKVKVIKIAKYDPTKNGVLSKYQGYTYITKGKLDIGIEKGIYKPKLIKSRYFCYSSNLKRAIETVDLLGFKNAYYTNLLSEVKFDLSQLLSEKEFELFGSNLVRERFFAAFVENKLSESTEDINSRMDKLIDLVLGSDHVNILMVSHSFYMKILDVYLHNSRIFKEREKIFDYVKTNQKLYNNFEGFEFNLI